MRRARMTLRLTPCICPSGLIAPATPVTVGGVEPVGIIHT